MDDKRRRDVTELAVILGQLDSTSLMLIKNSAEILLARDKLERRKERGKQEKVERQYV